MVVETLDGLLARWDLLTDKIEAEEASEWPDAEVVWDLKRERSEVERRMAGLPSITAMRYAPPTPQPPQQ